MPDWRGGASYSGGARPALRAQHARRGAGRPRAPAAAAAAPAAASGDAGLLGRRLRPRRPVPAARPLEQPVARGARPAGRAAAAAVRGHVQLRALLLPPQAGPRPAPAPGAPGLRPGPLPRGRRQPRAQHRDLLQLRAAPAGPAAAAALPGAGPGRHDPSRLQPRLHPGAAPLLRRGCQGGQTGAGGAAPSVASPPPRGLGPGTPEGRGSGASKPSTPSCHPGVSEGGGEVSQRHRPPCAPRRPPATAHPSPGKARRPAHCCSPGLVAMQLQADTNMHTHTYIYTHIHTHTHARGHTGCDTQPRPSRPCARREPPGLSLAASPRE